MHRFPVLLTYFIDSFGLAIVFPVFTPLVLGGHFTFLQLPIPSTERPLLIGFVVAAFPLAQLFGAPFFGMLSDRIGRKKVFLGTISGTALGYAISASSVLLSDLSLLILGRAWTGFFAGNLTLCLASLADLSKDEKDRVHNFSLLATTAGLSFILAIFAGGILVQVSPSIPFWLTCLLSFVNLFFMSVLFKETRAAVPSKKVHLGRGFQNVLEAYKMKKLRWLYFSYFFFIMTWVTSMQFLPTTLMQKFNFSINDLTLFLFSFGIIWSLSNLVINRYLAHKYPPHRLAFYCLLFSAIILFTLFRTNTVPMFTSLYIFYVLFAALSWTNILVTVSISASSDIQGKILGINQSVGAMAAIIGPSIGGYLAGLNPQNIFLFTSISCVLSTLFLKKSSQTV